MSFFIPDSTSISLMSQRQLPFFKSWRKILAAQPPTLYHRRIFFSLQFSAVTACLGLSLWGLEKMMLMGFPMDQIKFSRISDRVKLPCLITFLLLNSLHIEMISSPAFRSWAIWLEMRCTLEPLVEHCVPFSRWVKAPGCQIAGGQTTKKTLSCSQLAGSKTQTETYKTMPCSQPAGSKERTKTKTMSCCQQAGTKTQTKTMSCRQPAGSKKQTKTKTMSCCQQAGSKTQTKTMSCRQPAGSKKQTKTMSCCQQAGSKTQTKTMSCRQPAGSKKQTKTMSCCQQAGSKTQTKTMSCSQLAGSQKQTKTCKLREALDWKKISAYNKSQDMWLSTILFSLTILKSTIFSFVRNQESASHCLRTWW